MFKANLESFKKGCISINENNFWGVSRVLLEKIEGPSYLQNKEKQNDYFVKQGWRNELKPGGPLLNFHLQSSLGGASRHLARTRSQVHFGLAI